MMGLNSIDTIRDRMVDIKTNFMMEPSVEIHLFSSNIGCPTQTQIEVFAFNNNEDNVIELSSFFV